VTIQVGAYPSRATADAVRKRLTAQGYAARVVPAGRYYRVRVGRYATRAAAAPVVKKLKAARNEAIIVDADPLR
jgi:cell division protein FtsN